MRTILASLPAALLLAAAAAAEPARPLNFDPPASSKPLPVKPPKYDPSCAAYGAGFVRLSDSNTCVKIGGSISVGVGASAGHR